MSWHDDVSELPAIDELDEPERVAMLAELYAELITMPMRQLRERYMLLRAAREREPEVML